MKIFEKVSIEASNANIDVGSSVIANTIMVENSNGNIGVTIGNIGISNVLVDFKNGICRNTPKMRGVHTVSGYIVFKNGNVKFG